MDPQMLRQLAESQVNVELDTGDMILNLGPQHPATHGTLRLVVRLDGERVIAADPVIGYMHRGYEKLTEYRTYPQITTLINRIDWLSSFANEVPFIAGAEMLMDIEAPPRALYIRTILTELSRIATFLLFLGEMGLQVGAITPAFYGFRDREYVLNLIEGVTGGRFHPNFNRIGGLKDDLPWGWNAECKAARCARRSSRATSSRTSWSATRSSSSARVRSASSRPISAPPTACRARTSGRAVSTGTCAATATRTFPTTSSTGRCGRTPTAIRSRATGSGSQETRESARMVLQMIEQMPSGPIMAKVPRIIKVPEGEVWVNTENPLGEMGYYIVSKGATGPFRTKIRTASFSNVSILPWMLRGVYVPDIITILASLYFILGDIDK